MSEEKHTAGPFIVDPQDALSIVLQADPLTEIGCVFFDGTCGTFENSVADALLFAAAPDLLAALKYVQRELTYISGPWKQIVDAAIAKAEPA